MQHEPGCQRMPTAANAMQKCIDLSPVFPESLLGIEGSAQSVGKDIGTSSEELVRDR